MLFEEWEIELWEDYLHHPVILPAPAIDTINAAIKWKEPLTVNRARQACNPKFGPHPNPNQGTKYVYIAAEEEPVINSVIPIDAKHIARFDKETNEAGLIAADPNRYRQLFQETEETYPAWREAYLESLQN